MTSEGTDPFREIAVDEEGKILWDEPFRFKNISAAGEEIIRDGKTYRVVSSKIIGPQIHSILRKVE